MVILEARQVSKSYHTGHRNEIRALTDVSLTVESGQAVALVGPSGAGKTTLLALLGAIERPTRGEILFQGKELGPCSGAELTRIRRAMGFVFQSFALIPQLSALDNVTYPLIVRGVSRTKRIRTATEWLTGLGLEGRLHEPASALSGGEQQRVAAARALACEPKIILADEPTSNLDPESARRLVDELRKRRESGVTLILSSHDPRVIELADRVIELENGRLLNALSPQPALALTPQPPLRGGEEESGQRRLGGDGGVRRGEDKHEEPRQNG